LRLSVDYKYGRAYVFAKDFTTKKLMEYIDLSTHCLVKKMHSDRMQRIRFHEGDFFLPDADIAVLHNDALRRIRANQISDGMQLFVGYERQYYSIGEWFSREQFIC
jgi:hypothetical protein